MTNQCDTINELILQPTPFCNIDCKYCYLPLRNRAVRMSDAVMTAVFERIFNSPLAGDHLSVVWAVGEPMSLPIDFYEQAMAIARAAKPTHLSIRHGFQTNATLVTPEWCRFLKDQDIAACVSLDGPRYLHDSCRVTRSGLGTYDKAVEGVRLLVEHGIEVKAIVVISHPSLGFPEEIFRFFEAHGIASLGINFERIAGVNEQSSHARAGSDALVRSFLTSFFRLFQQSKTIKFLREYNPALIPLFKQPVPRADIAKPLYHQVCVDWLGNATLFSPTLLNMKHKRYGDFILGNLCHDSIESLVQSDKFLRIANEINDGVEQCWRECAYFSVCGGGLPANKLFENGSFATTETLDCRLTRKLLMDVFMAVSQEQPAEAGSPPLGAAGPG